MSLMLHVNAKPIDLVGLHELTTPAATATHVPIPHSCGPFFSLIASSLPPGPSFAGGRQHGGAFFETCQSLRAGDEHNRRRT